MQFRAWRTRLVQRYRDIRSPSYWRVFAAVALNAVLLSMLVFDIPIAKRMDALPPLAHDLARVLTNVGKSGWILFLSAFLFLESQIVARHAQDARARCRAVLTGWIGAYIFVTVAASGLVANILKRAIGRARPSQFDEWSALGFSPFAGNSRFESFPSGHATTIGALAAMLALMFPRYRVSLLTAGVWLAMTRVMLLAHYPSDVLAGFCLGGWFALVTAILFARYGLIFRIGADGWPRPRLPSPLQVMRPGESGPPAPPHRSPPPRPCPDLDGPPRPGISDRNAA